MDWFLYAVVLLSSSPEVREFIVHILIVLLAELTVKLLEKVQKWGRKHLNSEHRGRFVVLSRVRRGQAPGDDEPFLD